MSTSLNIERSWFASRQTTGFTTLSWFVSSSTLKFVLSREKRVWGAPSWRQTTGFPVLSWFISSSKIRFWPSREKRGMRCLLRADNSWALVICPRQTTGFTFLSCLTASSRNVFRSPENGALLFEGKQRVLIGNFLLVAQLLLLVVE